MLVAAPHFAPETNAGARRVTALVRALADRGWRVEVVTLAPHHPENRVHPGYGTHARETAHEDGVEVVRFRPWIVAKDRLAVRLLAELRFCAQAALHALADRRDLVVASSPYMFLGPMVFVAARVRGARFGWDVRDLTWEYLKATGKRTFGLDRAVAAVMRATARRVDVLTTATEGQQTYFGPVRGAATTIVNGLAPDLIAALEAGPPREDPERRPRVLYAGLIGFPQGLRVLLDAAAALPEADVVLAGDGPERAALEAEARTRGLGNVRFTGFVDSVRLASLYRDADVLVAHLRDDPAFAIAQPSKLWEYMATGRPVVYGGRGEAAAILEQRCIGVVAPPDDAAALATAVRRLLADPEGARSMGARGRAYVLAERDRGRLVARWTDLLAGALRDDRAA